MREIPLFPETGETRDRGDSRQGEEMLPSVSAGESFKVTDKLSLNCWALLFLILKCSSFMYFMRPREDNPLLAIMQIVIKHYQTFSLIIFIVLYFFKERNLYNKTRHSYIYVAYSRPNG